ncbi:MAG: hypothetical protein ACRYFX_27595 [Janthinobacterium lividum]
MRSRQILLLGLLLLVPVLAFLFLYGFGRNHYALPTYLPERADSVRTPAGGWQRDTVFHRVQSFVLLAASHHPVSSVAITRDVCVVQVLAGEPIYGHAVGVALLGADAQVSHEMMRLQEKFRREPRVRLVTLVPSPKKADSDYQLQSLNEQFGTISGKWFVLAAAPVTVDSLARYEFGLLDLQPTRLPFRPGTNSGNLPPGRLLLLDRDQHVRGYYDGTDIHELERLITEINVLLYTYDDRH